MTEQDPVRKLKNKSLEKTYKKDAKDYPKIEEGFEKSFYDFLMEEWKPFPKDKVNRQIDKKSKSDQGRDKHDAHVMKAVKNYKTKSTDFNKADQKMVGKDRETLLDKQSDHYVKRDSQWDKSSKMYDKANKKADKNQAKIDKWKKKNDGAKYPQKKVDKMNDKWSKKNDAAKKEQESGNRAWKRGHAMQSVIKSRDRATREDDRKQADHNKKDKESRATAKRMMNRAGLESAYKKTSTKNEAMNFTDWQNSLTDSIYEADGNPQCPPGYKWNGKTMKCEPKGKKDDVSGNKGKDLHPENGASYNVIGSHGMNGAPYAYEEGGEGAGE